MARDRPVRRTRIGARLAVPDRHQPLPERAARQRAPADATCQREPLVRPSPPASASRSGSSLTPMRCSRARRPRARPGGALRDARSRSRWRSSPGSSTCRPASAQCSCSATCSASRPPRSPRCSRRARPSVNSALQRARATLDAAPARQTASARRCRASARERELLARFAEAFEARRHRRRGGAADRRRAADDAARSRSSTRGARRSAAFLRRPLRDPRRAAASASSPRGPTASRRSVIYIDDAQAPIGALLRDPRARPRRRPDRGADALRRQRMLPYFGLPRTLRS